VGLIGPTATDRRLGNGGLAACDEGHDDLGGVSVEVLASPVAVGRGPRVSAACAGLTVSAVNKNLPGSPRSMPRPSVGWTSGGRTSRPGCRRCDRRCGRSP